MNEVSEGSPSAAPPQEELTVGQLERKWKELGADDHLGKIISLLHVMPGGDGGLANLIQKNVTEYKQALEERKREDLAATAAMAEAKAELAPAQASQPVPPIDGKALGRTLLKELGFILADEPLPAAKLAAPVPKAPVPQPAKFFIPPPEDEGTLRPRR